MSLLSSPESPRWRRLRTFFELMKKVRSVRKNLPLLLRFKACQIDEQAGLSYTLSVTKKERR